VFFAGKGALFGAVKTMFYEKKTGEMDAGDDEAYFEAIELPSGTPVNEGQSPSKVHNQQISIQNRSR
jgi:hypothetical protein